ncbi:aryl-alcohol dehydrogenase [Oxobacter pfennigii]|uniref:Aryl-alcohol dehydrogenase n=1 Tax=Oxobacter pfennigii TaxID=36849 RepID=A0A0P8YU01_9CLOT|nr:NAD(P)-dependent alcohol dehydrogenase [Oxobacter pfennigii]KPU43164.1 aryl-alcohol dehydrogenase [Oxobacter pfennigii]
MEIQAAVLHNHGEKFNIETVTLDEPKADEVLVKIIASGICLTDIHIQHQEYYFPLPAVLGHEGAGIVEKVGEGVSGVKPGDHVVLGYAYCGECQPCLNNTPYKCDIYDELNFGGRMIDGTTRLHHHNDDLSVLFGQSSFAAYAVVNINNIVKVDDDLDLKYLGPLGCGIQTGSGTIFNYFKAQAGSSIAVFGAGAVGLSAVMAAKAANCGIIIAVDIHDNRLELARELGATHVLNSRKVDVEAEIKRITNGGVDYALEASGHGAVGRQAVNSLKYGGSLAYVSSPPSTYGLDPSHVRSLSIRGIVEGDSVQQVLIPQLIKLYKEGKFPFHKLIRFYQLHEINQAIADSQEGTVIKSVIIMPT